MSKRVPEQLEDAEWLRDQYVTKGLTATQIAEGLGVSKFPVLVRLERAGIERRKGSVPRANRAEMREAYEAGASLSTVGRRFGMTTTGVWAALKREGVVMRPAGGYGLRKAKAWPQLMEPGWLEHQYVNLGKPMTEIARELGCCAQTVRRAINEKGITPRSDARPTAARTLSHRRLLQIRGKHPACVLCESPERLEIHHRDGDRANNLPENHVVLCRDCHAIAEWFIRPVEARLRGVTQLSIAT